MVGRGGAGGSAWKLLPAAGGDSLSPLPSLMIR